MSFPLFAAAPFALCLIIGAMEDLRRYIIPNACSLGLIGGFALVFPFTGLGWAELGAHLLAFATTLAVGFVLFAIRVWGAGDSKLLAAAALWLGPDAAITAALWTALLGGGLALMVLMTQRMVRYYPALALASPSLRRMLGSNDLYAPYGAAIAAGCLLAFPEAPIFGALAGF